ncbi:50S ribosomal protein L10, putative [Plasmodium knowlesi strain H]|uniref:50S ribosomal protein L10, putative n=3 Tax=Plasmodium knowlesi TaxID=5850 RepID=A0A5K1UXK0_PLAKH|nr:50S ribosomal protein L10, putative [Plasmodium knowlesi strain H]OTN67985.1 putative 50S ribosomal protein L10 [Plasmodium knowlesi]CAA9986941.1 50S ribosomal protein L10, putative [Plasmodium knowlesi strain H]SBO26478.1 50S ribosomal protein L10, putative [Plasmodium knowlesi strain H]SBO28145.1 50S ribosomal protein L10, putative [Plasmodium knowlesi strain H]VVS76415.1 50S ribosomal protein L10, putative [Plasmodium knowlesi strain H]|eukprot:XP_002258188.1 ribosomal protein l10, putative [Plasmodium knowlesi strain H]
MFLKQAGNRRLSLTLLWCLLHTICLHSICGGNISGGVYKFGAVKVPVQLSSPSTRIITKWRKNIGGRRNVDYSHFIRNTNICQRKKRKSIPIYSRKCSGYRNTREGKNEMIRKIKRILKVTKLLIQLNSFKLTPNMRMDLLINLPRPHVRVHMVKNTLMKLAVENTPFEAIVPYLKESNIYMFIMDEKYIAFTLYGNKSFSSMYKEYKINNCIKMSVYENTILNKSETENLINLKTHSFYFGQVVNKLVQLIGDIPRSIMQVPASIARGIYLHTQKGTSEGQTQ